MECPRLLLISQQSHPTHHKGSAHQASATADEQNAPAIVDPVPLPLNDIDTQEGQRLVVISQKLRALLPRRDDCVRIYQLGGYASLCYRQYFTGMFGPWKAPGPNFCEEQVSALMRASHPAVLGKRMMGLAATLQRVRHQAEALTEPPARIQRRLAQGVMTLVCDDDRLVDTLEGLECLVMQSVYMANGGDLRLALLPCRRAITVCHLMGLHQRHAPIHAEFVEDEAPVDPRLLWFRTVYLERMVCLLLGLPNTAVDMNDAGDGEFSSLAICNTPLGQLERAQCIVAAKIIKRNQSDPFFRNSRDVTQELDLELQRAAGLLPPRWWTVPPLNGQNMEKFDMFLETNKVLHQLFFHFLLVQLHLPFILRPSSAPENIASKITCTNASRDALTRFVAIRAASKLPNIPEASDFFALIAAIALLLVHIDAYRSGARGVDMSLRHQRQTDRALILDTLDYMRSSSSRSSDMLSKRSADVLKRLLEIEEDAAGGRTYTTSPELDVVAAGDGDEQGRARDFHLRIPHFGTLIISPDRPVARAPLGWGARDQASMADEPLAAVEECTTLQAQPAPAVLDDGMLDVDLALPDGGGRTGEFGPTTTFPTQGVDDLQQGQESWFPSISARVEDWAFQGVDAAFFDSIMRGLDSDAPSPHQTTWGYGRGESSAEQRHS